MPVDGQVYAQPLYLPALTVGGASHNVVFVATENNSLYAFDADHTGSPLWHVNFGTPIPCSSIPGCNRDLKPVIGITATPVIDTGRQTIYAVAETFVSGVASFWIHAIDYTTGRERLGSPVQITGSVAGTAPDSVGGKLAFNPVMHWQRAGLLLLNGNIYVGFAGHQDIPPYHGWLFGYDGLTLRRVLIKCITPNGSDGGIWQSGAGPAADSAGNVYLTIGNGTFDANVGGPDYGSSVVKMNAITGMFVNLYFTPSNFQHLNDVDDDLGSTGTILLPGEQFAVTGCKDGRLFLMNTANMGSYSASADLVAQEWATGTPLFGDPVFFNNMLYAWGRGGLLQAYHFNGAGFDGNSGGVTPTMTGADRIPSAYANEPAMSISSNATTAGSGILWATWEIGGSASGDSYQGVMMAYNAANLQRLWSSEDNHSRDDLGGWAKWTPPTIVNGKVYVASWGSVNLAAPGNWSVNVYGLLP